MTFTWPAALMLLTLVPILLILYVWAQRRRRAAAIQHSNVSLVRAAVGARRRHWTRHLPLAAMLLGLTALGVGAARPTMAMTVPQNRTSIIVALDVSRSMCSVDVDPNRFSAAKKALREFVAAQDPDTRIGLIAFAGYAEMVSPPSTDRGQLEATLEALPTGRGTAIGAAILRSVDAIASINPKVAPVGPDEAPEPPEEQQFPLPAPDLSTVKPPTTEPIADVVVLLTDGANTRGVLPMDAAAVAANRGIRVYPIGFGTTQPTQMVCTRDQLGADAYSEGGAYGRGNAAQFLVVDEPTLEGVAKATGATYSPATNSAELSESLADVPKNIVLTTEKVELSPAFAAGGALLLLLGVLIASRQRVFP